MGVPKFFRYISERYPCLSEKLKEYQIPEFDNLYLDMNGIIHTCSHPNDADVSFRITEETIFKNIFHYIEILFRIIQPQKLFFMAVDGVAPRAKINQQRGRRFRSAKEAEVLEAKARSKGQEIPKEARFDSNCITPGTVFMSRLNEQLKYFISYKISTDKLWQKCKIILSGSEVPGEGEHKIMDYIRYMKAQPDYEGNTRHCLYGLDADLIMLGLCSHEPHFSLLREEVKFGKTQKKILTPEETNFCLLHLSLMREYLEHEFSPVKDKLPFKFDIEKIIDDWILMGFLVGNDFIPHLPNLHIENNALPILYNAYMEVLPTLDGYINEAGKLNLERFEKFMAKLGEYDLEQFDEIYADLKFFESKTGRRLNESTRSSKSSPDDSTSPKKTNKALDALINATEEEMGETDDEDDDYDDEDSDDDTNLQLEFTQHKRDYYMSKMEYTNVDAEIMQSQAEGYIRAIQWNLHYYYDGCCSWSWYYPHHYAPYISDIKNFKDLKLEFDMGKPFLPFQQLLAVLPAASKTLLPTPYHGLMTEENSPIIKYYPLDFKTDLNGKKQEWEAVVLIPLIDEKSLLKAMEPCDTKLTPEEKRRNQHGPMSIFTYTEEDQGLYEAPEYFPSIRNHAKMELQNRENILIPRDKLVKGLCKGVRLSVYYPGFPTLQHIPHTACLAKAKVRVFEQASRKENMMLTVLPRKAPTLEELAQNWLGKTVFISWPHLVEALVVGVSNSKRKISIMHPKPARVSDENSKFITEEMNDVSLASWNLHRKAIMEKYRTRLGIEVDKIEIIVHAAQITGRRYVYGTQGKMTLEKQWHDIPTMYAYQTVVEDITVHSQDFIQFTSIADVFVLKSICFMLGHPHYGSMGEVTEPGVDLKAGRVKVTMRVVPEPSFDSIRKLKADKKTRFMPGNIAAQRLGISSHLLSRITGTIFVINGEGENPTNAHKHNLGLNLKFNKKNEEAQGFTRKDQNGTWLYSAKTIDFIRDYMLAFPELFENLEQYLVSSDLFMKDDLFPDQGSDGVEAAVAWLKEKQKSLGIVIRPCGTDELDTDVVAAIEKEIDDSQEALRQASRSVVMHVKPHLLYKPGLSSRSMPPDPDAQHRLLDRIVCVRESFTVPVGYQGTIIGVLKPTDDAQVVSYEVLFDKPFAGGLVIHNCSASRGYRLLATDFINISYGIQVMKRNQPGSAAVAKAKTATSNWRQPGQQQSPLHQPKQHQSPFRGPPEPKPVANWRQPQPQPKSPSRIPPDAAALSNMYPTFGKSSPIHVTGAVSQVANSPSHKARGMVKRNEQQATGAQMKPVVLQRFPKTATLPPTAQPRQKQQQLQQQQLKPQAANEFQALWNELNKIQKDAKDSPKRMAPSTANKSFQPPVMSMQPKQPNPPRQQPTNQNQQPWYNQNWPQDPSAFLKAMLKIPDDSSQSNKAPSTPTTSAPPANKPVAFPQPQAPPKTNETPALVQQLFDFARQSRNNSSTKIMYCSQLLSYYQLLGSGFPKYTYMHNKDMMVAAQIVLPDMRMFCGEFCTTDGQAAESAAKKVYEALNIQEVLPRLRNQQQLQPRNIPTSQPRHQPQQHQFPVQRPQVIPAMIQPLMQVKTFSQAPPQQRPQLQPPTPQQRPSVPVAAVRPQTVPQGSVTPVPSAPRMAVKPPMPQIPNPLPQWLNTPGIRQSLPAPGPPPFAEVRQQPEQQKHQQHHQILRKTTPFVPLQAQKKTRKQAAAENKHQQQQQLGEKKDIGTEKKPGPKSRDDAVKSAENNQNQSEQKTQKLVVKQRRSRVAAKFQSAPMSNGGQ
ncbi:hypothetical protein QAD02_023366 [Eretmocerus hayati]|uniref:Uncharacterized protein n=1 Tax=Eretmocerus hayati TaxID=131215 RepID=A0ACC2PW04_9HYME|nr:hypothetical protein QAD02_023366 [Eretmocerus hayati]